MLWTGALWAEPPSPAEIALLTQRAETAIRTGAPVQSLDAIRTELAALRETLSRMTAAGDVTVRALRAELAELPPPPDADKTEPRRIAENRARLTDALAEADAPQLAYRQSLARLKVLIADLDAMIRADQRAAMLQRGPSPLWPATWAVGIGQFFGLAHQLTAGIAPSQAGLAAGLFVLALAGWVIATHLMPRLEAREWTASGLNRGRVALSLALRGILPFGFAFLAVSALSQPFLTPAAWQPPTHPALICALILMAASWVAQALFAPFAPHRRILALPGPSARQATRLCEVLGLVVVVELLAEESRKIAAMGGEGQALLALAVIAVASALLWSLGRLLGRSTAADVPRLLAGVLRGLGLLAVVAVLFGFSALARALIDPLLITLWLIGLAIVLHRLISLLLAQLGRVLAHTPADAEGPQAKLMSIAVAGLLTLLLAPVVAVAWGARAADLADAILALRDGVVLGGVRISLTTVLVVVVAFGFGLFLTRWVQRVLRDEVLPNTRIDRGGQTAIVTGFGYLGVLFSALLALSLADISLASLAIVAGALSVGIGFGLQAIVSNFVSGLILLIERPIKEGDLVQVAGIQGYVRKIAVRATRIETLEGHDLIVPNADLITGVVRNMTLTTASGRIDVGLSLGFDADLPRASAILLEVARAHSAVLAHPAPAVLITGMGDSCVTLELRVFVLDLGRSLSVRSDLYIASLAALASAGMAVPYPVRDLRTKT